MIRNLSLYLTMSLRFRTYGLLLLFDHLFSMNFPHVHFIVGWFFPQTRPKKTKGYDAVVRIFQT